MIGRALRLVHHAVFHASREGRAAEIAGWSNAVGAAAVGATVFALAGSWALAVASAPVAFVLLRLALAHRVTVWIAAAVGTLSVSALGGGLAWLFGHVVESPSVPSIAAVVAALASAAAPAWSYAWLARRRASDVPDSLVDPVSVPPSR